ncbi:L-xylulose reductase [Longimycelium tulufanense]|uniref:L-xylulose reductase n=1 Tax=Longimycelium tulufanense TaxID=907463 RepID=A0A8J3C5J3_9PSEU|nr:glucose 1-dehydrogenase [Longimycelium tulufanense]GGM33598.1 L-xylulose reductase [Longimycelium tulufanense]
MAAQPDSERSVFDVAGRRALITGASQGIGAEIASTLARAGVDLVLSDRDNGKLATHAQDLRENCGVRVATIAADLSDPQTVEGLASAALTAFDGLDILVNNAGIAILEPVRDVRAQNWDAAMAVNLRAPALLAARVGTAMADAGHGGKIINVASTAALTPLAEHYAYCASKAALLMATKVLALELGPRGVRSNAVCPTVVMTELGQKVWGDEAKAAPMLARIPAGHFAVPSDVANAVLFLASAASDMVNGLELTVDGGYTAT